MKTSIKTTVLAVSVGLLWPALVSASGWKIDASHSQAAFSVRHMMVSNTTGRFQGIKGSVELAEDDLRKSKIDVTIDVGTIDTGDAKRDGHLKGADFFDATKHPTMRFVAKKIQRKGKKWRVTGDLTLRGVAKSITLDGELTDAIKSPWGQTVRGVHLEGKLNRTDFGLTWNKTLDKGGLLVGNEVRIEIDVELMKV